MTIRKATIEYIDTIHRLGQSVDEFRVNEETVNFWPKELLTRAVQSDDVLLLVAEDKEIQGFLIVNYNRSLKKGLIENIYVHPDHRGQGIGDQLISHMFELLPDMGCEYVATLVPPDALGALDLYTRNGFNQGEQFVWLDRSLDDSFKRKATP